MECICLGCLAMTCGRRRISSPCLGISRCAASHSLASRWSLGQSGKQVPVSALSRLLYLGNSTAESKWQHGQSSATATSPSACHMIVQPKWAHRARRAIYCPRNVLLPATSAGASCAPSDPLRALRATTGLRRQDVLSSISIPASHMRPRTK